MKKESYFCDVCKKKVKEGELVDVEITVNKYPSTFDGYSEYDRRNALYELCLPCAKKIGVLTKKNPERTEKEEKSLQDKLYDNIVAIAEETMGEY